MLATRASEDGFFVNRVESGGCCHPGRPAAPFNGQQLMCKPWVSICAHHHCWRQAHAALPDVFDTKTVCPDEYQAHPLMMLPSTHVALLVCHCDQHLHFTGAALGVPRRRPGVRVVRRGSQHPCSHEVGRLLVYILASLHRCLRKAFEAAFGGCAAPPPPPHRPVLGTKISCTHACRHAGMSYAST